MSVEEFRSRQPIALCVCGHGDDHPGKPCHHPLGDGVCPCRFGQRTDLAICAMLNRQGEIQAQMSVTLRRILLLLEAASGLQTKVVTDDTGRTRIDVHPQPPQLIVPPR